MHNDRMAEHMASREFRCDATAEVDSRASIGTGTTIWGHACVREYAVIGSDCIIGRGAYIEDGVIVGSRVKVQTNALLFKPARVGDDVFIGPGAMLTNDRNPRASAPDGRLKRSDDWVAEAVVIDSGASIGAGAIILPGIHIGHFALVAAGAVVAADVPDFALVVGCPAKRVGWVGKAGFKLKPLDDRRWICPSSGEVFEESGGSLQELDLAPDTTPDVGP